MGFIDSLKTLLFPDQILDEDENLNTPKPAIGTFVRSTETGQKGKVVPNDCHAIKVAYATSTTQYFKYSVFWEENEVVSSPTQKLIKFSPRN